MLRSLGLVGAPLLLGGMFVTGGFGGAEWSRVVDRPPAQVLDGLADLDIREQPGAPGTDPARSGGIAPLFRVERMADGMRWFVMSGDKVATVMTARLEPLDGDKTRVTAEVRRGDAPDDFVSPAFRSERLTLALFALALEGELNELVRPPAGDRRDCLALRNRFFGGPPPGREEPRSLSGAIGETSQTVMRLHAFDAEWRRMGCEAYEHEDLEQEVLARDPGFQAIMREAEDAQPAHHDRIVPGRSMVDPNAGLHRPDE